MEGSLLSFPLSLHANHIPALAAKSVTVMDQDDDALGHAPIRDVTAGV